MANITAIIMARGGSKGIPGKNIIDFCGKPLIAWTIEQALVSKYLDRIVVSTEDKEIAEISIKYGADIPFVRPKELAEDNAKGIDVVLHATDWFRENDKRKQYDLIILLQPTSPLRITEDTDKAIEFLFLKEAKAIVSVCEVDHHPLWANTLPEDGCMKNLLDKKL